ncbi:PAS domain S-box-containing protein/diguanylate cyclase (GGDEF)-like protein [Novosphingobium sp. ST904]|nr:PAS domain S-box-containing protein/diguanylate cyclase (GGDEF)-like protein [Novosphingobium sp. ST904]
MDHAVIQSRMTPAPGAARMMASDPAQLYAQAAALTSIGAWSCDLRTQELSWTEGVFQIFGAPLHRQMDRRETLEFYAEDSRATLERLRSQAIAARSGFSMEAQIRRADGELRWMRLTAATRVENGRPVSLYGMKQDITEERLRWERLRQMAENDALTGLSNRARFQSEFLDRPAGDDSLSDIGAIVLFDMNAFKAVNDRWGHAAGDACLTGFARRLRATFPEARLIARIGGDEFAMILDRTGSRMGLEICVRHRMNALASPVIWQERYLPLGACAGMAFPDSAGGVDPEALFHRADAALYEAKRRGGNVVCTAP